MNTARRGTEPGHAAPSPASDAWLALRLFALAPATLGGVCLRAGAGPVRDRWIADLKASLPPHTPWRPCPVHIDTDRLLGGLDLAATLRIGRSVAQRGLLAEADGGVVVLAMAERASESTVAHLAAALESGELIVARNGIDERHAARFGVLALDEGADADEGPKESLLDRAAFHVELDGLSLRELDAVPDATPMTASSTGDALRHAELADDILEALCAAALALGVSSTRRRSRRPRPATCPRDAGALPAAALCRRGHAVGSSAQRRACRADAVALSEARAHTKAMTTTMAAKDLDWCIDGANWPHRKASTSVEAGGIRWHVQRMGAGPVLLLVHGTGASTHSWRTLMPLLAERFSVIAPDLPGHGYTQIAPGSGMSLPGMSRLLQQRLDAVGAKPACVVGHSAGAAILARMAIDGRIAPAALVSLNGAFVPLGGMLRFLSPIARLMAATPLVARVFAGRAADPKALDRLLESTGSRLDATGTGLYARLVQSPAHVHGALTMMANWDLDPLLRDLARLRVPALLLAGDNDRTVPPDQAVQVAARIAGAQVERLPSLGHLAHEEAPARIAAIVTQFFARQAAGA